MIDSGECRAKHLGWRLPHATCALFEHWSDYRDGRISLALRCCVGWDASVARSSVCCCAAPKAQIPTCAGRAADLYEHRQRLWTALRCEGIEPTNNSGERSLRHRLIWRELSLGTQTASGSRFVETMLTVIKTCRHQRRDVFKSLTEADRRSSCPPARPFLVPRGMNG